jgi:DNA-binding transcriptional MocR family regulator
MLAAERFERKFREPGKRNGPLGPVGLEVLRDLLRLIDYRTGRLEPAITTLMGRLKRSRDAICRALAALREHGFLDWLRRWEPVEDAGEAGPQVKQATNAYRLALPPKAEKLLAAYERTDAPPPEDHLAACEARRAAVRAMVDALPLDEQPEALAGSGPLASALARLARGVMGRSVSPPSGQNPGSVSILLGSTAGPTGPKLST